MSDVVPEGTGPVAAGVFCPAGEAGEVPVQPAARRKHRRTQDNTGMIDRRVRYRSMMMMKKNHMPVHVPANTVKKARAAKKKPAVKGFFGLLPDWKIDTQALKDELRD